MTNQVCNWNPYGNGAAHYNAVWDEAKSYEGKRCNVIGRGRNVTGIVKLTTVCYPTSGIGISVFDGYQDHFIGGVFESIEVAA